MSQGRLANVRWLTILAIALWIGLASAQQIAYAPDRDTKCWECHNADPNPPRPLQAFWTVELSPSVPQGAPWTLQIDNAWFHEIRYLEPTFNLANAPGLFFVDDREAVTAVLIGEAVRHPASVTPARPPSILPTIEGAFEPANGTVTINVPSGATSLNMSMEVRDTNFAPAAEFRVYAGQSDTAGSPDFVIPAAAGEKVNLLRQGVADFQGLGYGNWTIQMLVYPAPGNQPNPFGTSVQFIVDWGVDFQAGAERIGVLSSTRRLTEGQAEIFAWRLNALAPAPGEYVELTVNGTVYHKHEPANNAIDWTNVTTTHRFDVVAGPNGVELVTTGAPLIIAADTPSASIVEISEIIGYMSAFTLVLSVVTGGMFGRQSRRFMNRIMGGARHRVAFHNILSYGLTAAALIHTIMFIALAVQGGPYSWTLGLIWGGLGLLCMLLLGVTGALQVPIIRKSNYPTWKWIHFWLAILAVVFTILHLLLDGAHFGPIQDAIGWENPIDRRAVTA
jgi:hypothetical protein